MQNIYHRLAGRRPSIVDSSSHLVSAVLLPLVEREGRCHVLFELRSRNLNRQPGEISFPGGRVENSEQKDPLAAALRETSEELGIPPRQIDPIGPLDILVTPFGAMIYPYVGKIDISGMKPNPCEVEEIFLVPVDFFLSESPYVTHVEIATRYQSDFPLHKVPPVYKKGWQVKTSYPMYFYDYGKHFIWGMTGKILFNFLTVCWPDHPVWKKPFKQWADSSGDGN